MQAVDPKGSFLKNLLLSLFLIGLSSLLIPFVLKQIDDQKFDAQQQYEAELARQDKIIDGQAALLDTLAQTFWDYVQYAADVLYSRDPVFGQDDWHQRAVAAYYQNSGPLLAQMRADISTLLRLAPRSSYDAFLQLYEAEIMPFDACLLELMKVDGTGGTATRCTGSTGKFAAGSWETLSTFVLDQELANLADQVFTELAQDFQLHAVPEYSPARRVVPILPSAQ